MDMLGAGRCDVVTQSVCWGSLQKSLVDLIAANVFQQLIGCGLQCVCVCVCVCACVCVCVCVCAWI